MSEISRILVIGAMGQIGSELTPALRERYGAAHVIAADLYEPQSPVLRNGGPFELLDIRDRARLDAVKHVPGYFFGEQWAGGKDSSSAGYCGQAQWQFNMTRGYDDWDSHRDTVFDVEKSYGRNDLMMFGEHMGEPPSYDEYWAAGMRLVDARTHQTFNDNFGNSWGSLSGLDSADYISGKQMGRYGPRGILACGKRPASV